MEKRISARGIIIEDNNLYVIFRRRINPDGTFREYYVIPGGGVDSKENLEEAVIRELKEELSIDVKVNGYVGKDEGDASIAHFFACSKISGKTTLGGEEALKNSPENYYEIKKINIKELDKINILSKDIILKAFNKEYVIIE